MTRCTNAGVLGSASRVLRSQVLSIPWPVRRRPPTTPRPFRWHRFAIYCRRALAKNSRAAVVQQPYADLGQARRGVSASERDDVVIITARFRTGSTLLWQLFRAMPGYTSYYEPLAERRWFDPKSRGDHIDATHRGVTDYWREYEGLEELKEFYHESWIAYDLLMTEDAYDP